MCEIQWVDAGGAPTKDDNPPIGRVRCRQYRYVFGRRQEWSGETSRWFTICAEHAKQLAEPGMDIWEFERAPDNTV